MVYCGVGSLPKALRVWPGEFVTVEDGRDPSLAKIVVCKDIVVLERWVCGLQVRGRWEAVTMASLALPRCLRTDVCCFGAQSFPFTQVIEWLE